MSGLPGVNNKKKVIALCIFRVIALCRFGNKDILKSITASNLRFSQQIEVDE